MKINSSMIKNDVKAENQTREKQHIFIDDNAKIKILFLGNSITLHEKLPEIGWFNNWGMAASSQDKDYVHLTLKFLKEKYENVSYCITNVGEWELNYWKEEVLSKFDTAKDFNADIVILRFGENVRDVNFKDHAFAPNLEKFAKNFIQNAKKVVVTDLFWEHELLCKDMKNLAEKYGFEFVQLSDLGYSDENMAKGLFEHQGVAMHPGDLGMKRIADRIIEKL